MRLCAAGLLSIISCRCSNRDVHVLRLVQERRFSKTSSDIANALPVQWWPPAHLHHDAQSTSPDHQANTSGHLFIRHGLAACGLPCQSACACTCSDAEPRRASVPHNSPTTTRSQTAGGHLARAPCLSDPAVPARHPLSHGVPAGHATCIHHSSPVSASPVVQKKRTRMSARL